MNIYSYDENLLVWDIRNMSVPLAETGLGGGIWRIKWDPHEADYILTATMYNGFHIAAGSLGRSTNTDFTGM